MPRLLIRTAAGVGMLAAAGALTACTPLGEGTSNAQQAGVSDVATASASTHYRDGTYTETADYQSPGGQESVTVRLTVADDVVTAVTVTGSGHTPNAQHYQAAFASAVGAAVKGKKLATLSIDRLAGSSLTPQGFDAAVAKIRADAAE